MVQNIGMLPTLGVKIGVKMGFSESEEELMSVLSNMDCRELRCLLILQRFPNNIKIDYD